VDPLLTLAFDHAFASIEGHDGPLVPFVLVDGAKRELLRVVVGDSAEAQAAGRRLARERAATASGYALAYEAYVRAGGERRDAIVVETASAGDAEARLFVQAFERQGTTHVRLGEPTAVGARRSALLPVDPFALDWGSITPDVVSKDETAIHVVNHALGDDVAIERTLRFVAARMALFARHLPPTMRQAVIVDDRGQAVSSRARSRIRERLGGDAAFVRFLGEES
jgi:hypothetical protein